MANNKPAAAPEGIDAALANDSGRLLETIFENTHVLVAFLDTEFRFIRVNRAYAAGDERDPSFYVGKNHFDLFPNEENQKIFERVRDSGEPYEARAKPFEYAEHPERGVSHWDWTLVPIKNSNNRVTGLLLTLLDVTHRIQTEEALRRSEERCDLALSGSCDGIWDWIEPPRDQCWWSPRVYEMFGYEQDEIEATISNWTEMMHPEDRDRAVAILNDHLSIRTPYDVEFRTRTKSGEYRWFRARGQALWNDQGRAVRMAGSLQDVTRDRAMQAHLAQSQRLESLGTMAGGIAHDFNNILSAITGYAELAQLAIPSGNRAHADLAQVLKATARARDLVQQILAFSRRTEPSDNAIPISPVISQALKLLRSTIPTTVEFRIDLARNVGFVRTDPTQLHQLLINLCTNAQAAMPPVGGILDVQLRSVEVDAEEAAGTPGLTEGRHALLVVADNGRGMDEETLARIFEPFFTTHDHPDATGMGLAVVHGVVQACGGAIRVASEPGGGTAFYVYLPTTETPYDNAAIDDSAALANSGHVLFVDDEPALLELGVRILRTLGYRATEAEDGNKAFEKFRESPDGFDLVITDQTMPEMTGIELAKRMLKIRPDLPIILCTGYSDQVDAERAENAGIRLFLQKPIAVSTLAAAVRRATDDSPARKSEGDLPRPSGPSSAR